MIAEASACVGLLGDARYPRLALQHREEFISADPFPHTVIDDFLPISVARELARHVPAPNDESYPWVVSKKSDAVKQYIHHEPSMPLPIRQIFRELNSHQGLLFFELLTGTESLLPDPYLVGGGIHISGGGDFLGIHADFNWHHKLLAYRRINAILYLTENWDESWGGATELWSCDGTERRREIPPRFNRLLVFETSENSYHGHPVPLELPENVFRRTLNIYYYHRHARTGDPETTEPHWTNYKTDASPFAESLLADYGKGVD
jgi:Rps23 Pro-64 3,4-dihydroxylase Tpa1-like proline 4-hydroxylase